MGEPFDGVRMAEERQAIADIRFSLEKAFMSYCYQLLGVDFPERGFLLFWQLPLDDKLRYFETEDRIAALKEVAVPDERQRELDKLLGFLGTNPIAKVDKAFTARFGAGIKAYLGF